MSELDILRKNVIEDLKEIERLNYIINKAIEYIETNEGYSQLSGIWEFYGDTDELIKILRGVDK